MFIDFSFFDGGRKYYDDDDDEDDDGRVKGCRVSSRCNLLQVGILSICDLNTVLSSSRRLRVKTRSKSIFFRRKSAEEGVQV